MPTQQITIQPAAAAGQDARVSGQFQTTNYATGLWIYNRGSNNPEHGVIRFPSGSIPQGTIVSAKIQIKFAEHRSGQTYNMAECLRAWTETGVTWQKYDGVNAWAAGGGLGAGDKGSNIVSAYEPALGWVEHNLSAALVTQWRDGTNNGLIFYYNGGGDGSSICKFATSDYGTAADRPKLVITYYTTPPAPTGCTAHYEATDKSHCHWTDNSSYEDGFDVDYRINGGSWVHYQTTGIGVTTSSTYTVGANKYIEWRVRAFSGSLYSGFSYSGIVYTTPTAPSSCVSSYVATNNAKCVWNDNSAYETNFRIEVSVNGAGYVFWKNVGAGVTDSGTYTLGANKKIALRVRSYIGSLVSSYATSGETFSTPSPPTGATTHYIATNKAHLHWNDNSLYESGFRLEYAYGAAGWTYWYNAGAGVVVSSDGSFGANTRVKIRVRSYIGGLYSAWSEGSYIYTIPTTPSSVNIVWATLNETITVSWNDNSAYEQDFEIAKYKDGGWSYGTYDVASPYSDTAPTGLDHRYRHAVRARCPDGRLSGWAYSGYIYSTPNTPSGIALSWLSQDETVRITYTDNATYNQDIDIEKAVDGGGYGHLVYDVASPYDDTAPTGLNHRYIYRVRARCPDGQLSGWNTASKHMYSTPAIPTGFGLTWLSQDETVRVAYTKNHPYGDLDIYKETDGGGSGHLAYDAASPYDDAAPAGLNHKYEYKIRARTSQSDDGTYEYSSFTSVVPIYSIPNAPSSCSISLGTINVIWTDNSTYEDGFQVERQLDGGGWGLVHTTAAEAESWGDASQPTGSNIKYEYRVRAKIASLYSTYSTSNAIFVKTCSESINLSDVYLRTWSIYRTFTESISLSDVYSRVCNWFRVFIESITLADTLQKKPAKTFTENLTLADTLQKKPAKTFTEAITLTDIYSRVWSMYRTFTESLTLTDTLIKKPIKTFIESLHLTDTLLKRPTKTFTESITLTDVYLRVWTIYRTFTESLSLADTVSKRVAKAFIETLHLQDTYTRVVTWYRVFTENITLIDTIKKQKQNLLRLWKKVQNLFDIEG